MSVRAASTPSRKAQSIFEAVGLPGEGVGGECGGEERRRRRRRRRRGEGREVEGVWEVGAFEGKRLIQLL